MACNASLRATERAAAKACLAFVAALVGFEDEPGGFGDVPRDFEGEPCGCDRPSDQRSPSPASAGLVPAAAAAPSAPDSADCRGPAAPDSADCALAGALPSGVPTNSPAGSGPLILPSLTLIHCRPLSAAARVL